MIECEANYLLKMPLAKRRQALDDRVKHRGAESVNQLKAVMGAIHAAKLKRT